MLSYGTNPPATSAPPPAPGKSKNEANHSMTYQNTASMMLSDDYKEQFKAEYWQLRIRYGRISIMTARWDSKALDFVPDCPRSLYNLQMEAMEQYLAVLEARAKIEGIEL